MVVKVVMVSSFTFLVALANFSYAAPVQWTGNGHYYEVVAAPSGITWGDADIAATNAGGHLATVT